MNEGGPVVATEPQAVAPELQAYRLAQAEAKIERQSADIAALREQIASVERKEEERERKRLLWGISALGSILMMAASVIWSYRGVIFK